MKIIRMPKSVLIALPLILVVFLVHSFLPETDKPAQPLRQEIKPLHPVGEYLGWAEVDTIFPRYSCGTLIDQQTELEFRVQRRAGSGHADVQPLTARDTAVMKTIYGGAWSWKRRAVVLVTDSGRRVGASMNGMPHGAGAISNNDFAGHFCLHFRDSRIHSTGKIDLAHQIMVWKAANIINQQLRSASPEDLIRIFFAALDQQDQDTCTRILEPDRTGRDLLITGMSRVKRARTVSVVRIGESHAYRVYASMAYEGLNKAREEKFIVSLVNSAGGGFLIDPASLLNLIDSGETKNSVPGMRHPEEETDEDTENES